MAATLLLFVIWPDPRQALPCTPRASKYDTYIVPILAYPTFTPAQVFNGHSSSVTCGSFTPDGKHIVTGGGENDASVRIWNPKSGECTTFMQGHGFHQAGEQLLGSRACTAGVLTILARP